MKRREGKTAVVTGGAQGIWFEAADVENVVKVAGTVDVLYDNAGIFWAGHDNKVTEIDEGRLGPRDRDQPEVGTDTRATTFAVALFAGDL